MGISRSQYNYTLKKKEDPKVIAEILRIKEKHPRFGIRRVHALVQKKGFLANRKKIARILRKMDLLVKKKKRPKRLKIMPIRSITQAARSNQVWSIDFITAALISGEKFRCFTIVDNYSRISPHIVISKNMNFFLPVRSLENLRLQGVSTTAIILDNGPEFNNYEMEAWSKKNNISLHFIDPGEPTQNGYIESFNGKLRDECINQNRFISINDAKIKIEKWLKHYNEERPHSSLDYLTPLEFAKLNEKVLDIQNAI